MRAEVAGGRSLVAAAARLATALLVLLAVACTPSRREIRGDAVRDISMVGNGGLLSGHNDLLLRRAMVQRQSPPLTFTWPFMYFNDPAALSLDALESDARRLEVWYAHHGWFDARFLGWELRRVRARDDQRAGVVDVIGHVDPGLPSFFDDIVLAGEWSPAARTVINATWRSAGLEKGDQFSLSEVQASAAAIADALQDATYAYADVEPLMEAFPERREVDVTLDITPGISATIGDIRIRGLRRIDPRYARWSLGFDPGRPYRISTLRQARSNLFGTELFSVVDVSPDLSDPTRTEVPVTVTLTEAPFRRFRVGGGVFYDYFNVGPNVTFEFRDLHLFGTMWEMRSRAGAGAIIGVAAEDVGRNVGVLLTGLGELRFEYPWFLKGRLSLDFGGEFRQDVQFGSLPYRELAADVSLVYRWSRWTTLSGGPIFQFFSYIDPSVETLLAAQIQFGGDFGGQSYRLLGVDLRLRSDFRDDPLRTRRGSFWGLDVRQSIPIPAFALGADVQTGDAGFLYTRFDGDVRAWWPVRLLRNQKRFPVVLAGRLHLIGLVPWKGQDEALPYPDLAFLGGPTSLRSFRTNQLGPYDALCFYDDGRPNPQHNNGQPYDVDLTYLPRGGAVGGEALAELRYDFDSGVSVSTFGELGLLSRRWNTVSAGDLRGGGGVGFRYYSPIGPVRLDVGLRPVYPEDRGAARYIGCNPIDRIPRGYDILTGSRLVREDLDKRRFPLAINLFLAIGEPF